MSNGFNLFGNTPPVSRNVDKQIRGAPVPYQQVPASGLNFLGMQNASAIASQTQTNGQLVALAAVIILSEASGLFEYDIDVAFADDTTAKTVQLRAVLFPCGPQSPQIAPTSPIALGITQSPPTAVGIVNLVSGPAYSVVDPDGHVVVSALNAGQLTQDSGGLSSNGLLFGGYAGVPTIYGAAGVPMIDTVPNAVILWDQKIDTLDGLLSNGDDAFHAHGRCGLGAGVPLPGFGPGNFAGLVLELVSTSAGEGADVVTFGSCSMSLAEVG